LYTRRQVILSAAASVSANPESPSLLSPNRRIKVVVRFQAGKPSLTVYRDGPVLLECSGLGPDLDGKGTFSNHLQLVNTNRSRIDNEYKLVCGKTASVSVQCNQLLLNLLGSISAVGEIKYQIIIRTYDDGVAFRYRLAPQRRLDHNIVHGESTQFTFPRDYQCWGSNLGAFDTSHEGEFLPFRISEIRTGSLFDAPLVCVTDQGDVTFAIAEADLNHYPALYFAPRDEGALGVKIKLPPRPDDGDVAVRIAPQTQLVSPWRVIMIGDHPGQLIESTLLTTLSAPSKLTDTDWIKPGKAAWDWWSGATLQGVVGPRMSNPTMMRLIDFATTTKLQYLLIDAGWYAGPDSIAIWPHIDITRSVAEIDLPLIIEYGRQRGISVFLWVNWRHINAQMQQAMAWYQQIGIRGIKVDFMNRDDQPMIDFYHRLLEAASDHHLMVDLHGATHCTGLTRTFPNLMTQEGVMGAEYNKWTNHVTSRHNVTLPYTRMLLGPMDYTPGGFRNVTPEQFVARAVLPMVQTTRGQALAMYVVYDSPFACVSDSPDVYQGQDGVDFLGLVPTSWDETRFLSGQIGHYIVLARCKGTDWFIGAMTDMQKRVVAISLEFIGVGTHSATIYADGASPSRLAIERGRAVRQDDTIDVTLAANGGAVVIIKPSV
jgi:alpha-glucosidase